MSTSDCPADDPTIAELLKPLGYATGQFGKNHLGDLNKYLPTAHGFDEFFGNLYHLNAEEEPENADYPTEEEAPLLRASTATARSDPLLGHREGLRRGRRAVRTTWQTTRRGHRSADQKADGDRSTTRPPVPASTSSNASTSRSTPFFVWMNMTHMHFRTHTKPESLGQAGRWQSPYHDTMIDHDKNVGQLLDLVDELGIAEDTIVIYSTDNGPHANSWPDGATTPFRSEKATNWEGAFRIPEMVRWPGKITPGSVSNDIIQHHDWLPTFLAAAGEPDIVEKLKKGHKAGDRKYKVHIDGYNLLPYLTGEVDKSPRRGMIYFSDDCDVLGIRYENWKVVFRSNGARAPYKSGSSRSPHCARRSCSTCEPTRSSTRTSPRTRIGTGS